MPLGQMILEKAEHPTIPANQNPPQTPPAPPRSTAPSSGRLAAGFTLIFFLYFALILALRLVFLGVNHAFLKGAGVGAIAWAMLKGVRFDAAATSYLMIPALLLYATGAAWRPRLFRTILRAWLALAAVVVLACALGDLQYFEDAGKHLSYEALAYLNLSGMPVFVGAFRLQPVLTILSLVVTGLAGWGAYRGLGWLLRRVYPRSRHGRPLRALPLVLLFLPLLVLGRGGLQSRPITIGDATISPNPYLNAICLSPVFSSLFTAVTGEREQFHFYDDASNTAAVRRQLGLPPADPSSTRYPLLTTSPGQPGGNRKNVVIFILESWSGKDLGALGSKLSATPVFDGLAREGVFFPNFFANGIRTAEGMVSILCAYPNQPVLPVLKRSTAFQTHWRALSQILGEAGYTNIFIHGRDLDFDNVANFLRLIRFNRIVDRRDFPPSVSAVDDAWPGYNDMDVMRRAESLFAEQKGKPFLGAIYLMNTHPPFMTPDDFPKLVKPTSKANRFINSLRYTDAALGVFFDQARKHPYFKDTIFLFVADHARTGDDKFTVATQHHIPFLVYSPGYLKPEVCRVVGSQVDILPTVLGLLKLQARHASWGRDLFAVPEGQGVAISVAGNEIRWRDKDVLLNDSLSALAPQFFELARDPNCANDAWAQHNKDGAQLQKQLRAYLSLSQMTLYQNRVAP